MADYYPLLAKAVAALPDKAQESRAAIYARARNALLGQLRSLDPPVPEADVERESRALEDAVARLEIEFAAPPPSPEERPLFDVTEPPMAASGQGGDRPARADGPEPELGEPETGEPETGRPAPEAAAPEALSGDSPASPPFPAEPGERPSLLFKVRRDAPRPTPEAPESAAGLLAPPPRQPRWTRGAGAGPSKPSVSVEPGSGGAAPQASASTESETTVSAPGAAWPQSARDNGGPLDSSVEASGAEAPDGPDGPDGEAGGFSEKNRPETQRPVAPQPPQEAPVPKRGWIVAAIVAVVVALVAIAAIKLKDRREDLIAKSLAPAPAIESGSSGKIVDRIGGGDAGSDGQSQAASSEADSGVAESQIPPLAAPRAALLVRAPQDNAEVKTYQGNVVWKVDNVSSGPGAPLTAAVRAEIDIPEQKIQAVMTLQKNDDATLPASHTMKLQFSFPRGGEWRGVQQIKVPQMRREEASTGEALKGVPVPIVDNSFLVGLNRGPAEAANLDLLRSREWIDVPILLGNGYIAKLTFEKGQAGQRAINDAIAAWQAP